MIRMVNLDSVDNLDGCVALAKQFPGIWLAVVFDLEMGPEDYKPALAALKAAGAKILGSVVDSDSEKSITIRGRRRRFASYLSLGDLVDVWECGNEINGEWCGGGMQQKCQEALQLVRAKGYATALTWFLTAQNFDGVATWMQNHPLPPPDYALLSWYPYWNGAPDDWNVVFSRLASLVPNAKVLGFREFGFEPYGTAEDFKTDKTVIVHPEPELVDDLQALARLVYTLKVMEGRYQCLGGMWRGRQYCVDSDALVPLLKEVFV